tara:strand:+ start:1048 stop:1206 length:159 start_codon:yes stop_codon:yes gene_type:complete
VDAWKLIGYINNLGEDGIVWGWKMGWALLQVFNYYPKRKSPEQIAMRRFLRV